MTNDNWTFNKLLEIHNRLDALEETVKELRATLQNLQRAFPR